MLMTRRRCADCGFLARSHSKVIEFAQPIPLTHSYTSPKIEEWSAPATPHERTRAEFDKFEPFCGRGIYDLSAEMKERRSGSASFNRVDATEAVLYERRDCQWFEHFRPGLSFEGHLDLQHRRTERAWTAGVALAAAIIGGLMVLLPQVVGLAR